jgi:hypothetical protein
MFSRLYDRERQQGNFLRNLTEYGTTRTVSTYFFKFAARAYLF